MVQPLRDDRQQIFSTFSMQENNGRSSVKSTQQMAANWSTLQNAIQNQNKGPLICLLTIFLTVFSRFNWSYASHSHSGNRSWYDIS